MRGVRSRPRWVVWALIGYVLVAVVVLISPIGPGEIIDAVVRWIRADLGFTGFRQGWIEAPANVLLFVPLGLLLTLLLRRPWTGILLALVLSAGAELVQTLLPARQASMRDVIANVLGAAIGAGIGLLILRHRSRPRTATMHAE